jgi:hypothetical protein
MNLRQPGNRADLATFNSLWDEARQYVITRANELYDGTRTAARCWKLALMEVDPSADPRKS